MKLQSYRCKQGNRNERKYKTSENNVNAKIDVLKGKLESMRTDQVTKNQRKKYGETDTKMAYIAKASLDSSAAEAEVFISSSFFANGFLFFVVKNNAVNTIHCDE